MIKTPIQVTEEGVLIPLDYLQNAREFELELQNDNVLIRPKPNRAAELHSSESTRFSFVGIGRSSNPNASAEVEEILQRELGLDDRVEKI